MNAFAYVLRLTATNN